jgi:hypothetical protein
MKLPDVTHPKNTTAQPICIHHVHDILQCHYQTIHSSTVPAIRASVQCLPARRVIDSLILSCRPPSCRVILSSFLFLLVPPPASTTSTTKATPSPVTEKEQEARREKETDGRRVFFPNEVSNSD